MFQTAALALGLATLTSAQYGPGGQYGPDSSGSNPSSGSGGSSSNSNVQFGGFDVDSFLGDREKVLVAHGVMASLAFVLLFPMGSILIRLGSFRGLWLVHGLFQTFAYLIYIAAFGIGVWIVRNIPVDMIGSYHPVIGIIAFCLLLFQPILGAVHHFQFKKYRRRTTWSHGHLWLGRIVITLGMINGGLGLLWARQTGFYAPSQGQVIAYGVVAAIMWVLWVCASIYGERKRAKAGQEVAPAVSKEQYA